MSEGINRRTNLKKGVGRNRYCFATAAAAVTGMPTHEIATAAREELDKRAIMGVDVRDAYRTMSNQLKMNIEIEMSREWEVSDITRHEYQRMTFARWLEIVEEGIYMVVSACHWVAVDKGEYEDFLVDTMNRVPVKIGEHDTTYIPKRGIVTSVIKIIQEEHDGQ